MQAFPCQGASSQAPCQHHHNETRRNRSRSEFMHIERPAVLWEADTQDEVFIRLLGEMISFALQRSLDVSALTLNVANVVIDPHAARGGTPAGEYLAVTVRGPGLAHRNSFGGRLRPSHLGHLVT
jgi:hypothetical protein